MNPEAAAKEAKERANAKKERERREKLKEIERERARAVAVSQQKAKTNLKHVRMIQRNLVYIIGLSLTLAREEVLRRSDMFGKFGRLLRVLVNRSHPYNADAPGGPSISAYVQFSRDCDASSAVRGMSNAVFDGREIRCAIATTKYCDAFVRSGISEGTFGCVFFCGSKPLSKFSNFFVFRLWFYRCHSWTPTPLRQPRLHVLPRTLPTGRHALARRGPRTTTGPSTTSPLIRRPHPNAGWWRSPPFRPHRSCRPLEVAPASQRQ